MAAVLGTILSVDGHMITVRTASGHIFTRECCPDESCPMCVTVRPGDRIVINDDEEHIVPVTP